MSKVHRRNRDWNPAGFICPMKSWHSSITLTSYGDNGVSKCKKRVVPTSKCEAIVIHIVKKKTYDTHLSVQSEYTCINNYTNKFKANLDGHLFINQILSHIFLKHIDRLRTLNNIWERIPQIRPGKFNAEFSYIKSSIRYM